MKKRPYSLAIYLNLIKYWNVSLIGMMTIL